MGAVWRLFLATPEAVPAARHALDSIETLDAATRHVVELLTSELVTNAVKHGSSDPHESILISVRRQNGSLRVEVCDEGPGFERDLDPGDLLEPGGNGLVLVDTLARRWGVKSNHPNCVWFETDLAAERPL